MTTPFRHFGPASPIFRVQDLAASLRYYVDLLGFGIDWEHEGLIASVSRDSCCIFLSQGDQGNPGEPFGEWLDMHGRRWVAAPEGGSMYLDP